MCSWVLYDLTGSAAANIALLIYSTAVSIFPLIHSKTTYIDSLIYNAAAFKATLFYSAAAYIYGTTSYIASMINNTDAECR